MVKLNNNDDSKTDERYHKAFKSEKGNNEVEH